MDARQQFADRMLYVFTTQLILNALALLLGAVTLSVVIYMLFQSRRFNAYAKDYFSLTKQYIDLVTQERGQVEKAVHEGGAETRQKVAAIGEEIKQEIHQQVAAVVEIKDAK